jgi:hypothetical protein
MMSIRATLGPASTMLALSLAAGRLRRREADAPALPETAPAPEPIFEVVQEPADDLFVAVEADLRRAGYLDG